MSPIARGTWGTCLTRTRLTRCALSLCLGTRHALTPHQLIARQEQYHWTTPCGKPVWVHFRPSHLDDPTLLVKRLPHGSPEVALLRFLASERMRYHPDNPVSEGLGLLVRQGWAWVCVEEKKDVRGLYLGGPCEKGFRKGWGGEKGNLMHQMLRVCALLSDLTEGRC